jgi:hypothetical protein
MGHQGPLLRHDKDYNGSRFNVLVECENGEITTEPLSVIAADNPVTCAVYAREHDLLDVEGWKRFRNLAKHEKHFLRLVKQAKMKYGNVSETSPSTRNISYVSLNRPR